MPQYIGLPKDTDSYLRDQEIITTDRAEEMDVGETTTSVQLEENGVKAR